jgi:DNA-binding SARP family transcriptional activator
MANTFRHEPPRADPEWIARPRLVERIGRRFERQVMLVIAPAGYGKTAALAQALDAAANPDRVDRWLQCEPADADAEHLIAGMLRSVGLDPSRSGDSTTIAEALLGFAPQEVCLVLDDVHDIEPGSAGARLLEDLAEQLPLNAHLVLSGRARPSLRIARLQVAGEVEVLDQEVLSFDPDEIDRLDAGTLTADAMASWPAWAALVRGSARHGRGGADYLLEEVVSTLDEERVAILTALCVLSYVDDRIASAAAGRPVSAAALVADLPLVHQSDDGEVQLHDLWRQALAPHGSLDPTAAAVLARVAEHQLRSGEVVSAAEQFAIAGDLDGLRRAGIELLSRPLTGLAAQDVRQVHEWCRTALPDDPVTTMLDATIVATGDERASALEFEAAARHARSIGRFDLEALAIQNAMNMRSILDPNDFPDSLLLRAEELAAEGHDTAAFAATSIRSHRFRTAGDAEQSAAELWKMVANRSPMAEIGQAFGYGDLGRPEDVGMPTDGGDPTTIAAQAGGQHLAQAIWLRGEVTPELALTLGSELAAHADDFQMAHVQVPTNAVLALVAVAAGDDEAAARFVERALAASNRTAAGHVRSFADVARAALLVSTSGDHDAQGVIDQALQRTPIGNWPPRPYLYSLPMVYLLAPQTRATIDRCRFGPAITVAARAGQALVALREDGDVAPAAALPWLRPDLLRAHVLPPHLAELAAAAGSTGDPDVQIVLSSLPGLRDRLEWVADRDDGPSASWARSRISTLPRQPAYDLHVRLFGATTLARGGVPIDDASWVRRERVRELLAVLALHRRISRQRAAALIWPDLAEDRALSNLRVNLHHLHAVIQPSRGDELPWFVQVQGDELVLAPTGVTIDVESFEQRTADARRLDGDGRSTAAMRSYREAVELYRGDLAEDLGAAAWIDSERARLRALATSSMNRLGELLLARGEPEDAARYATELLRIEPLHERGGRLLASCLEAQDDRVGAARLLGSLLAMLSDEGLRPERSTLDQLARLSEC